MKLNEWSFGIKLKDAYGKHNYHVDIEIGDCIEFHDEDEFKNQMISKIISPMLTAVYSKLEPEIMAEPFLMCARCRNMFEKEEIEFTGTLKLPLCKNCMEALRGQ